VAGLVVFASLALGCASTSPRAAFDDVTRAQTEVQTKVFLAEQDANRTWREAEADKYRLDSQVAAYQREQSLLAAAEVENFAKRLAAYRDVQGRDPALVQQAARLVGLSAPGQAGGSLMGAATLATGSIAGGQYLNALWWDEMSRLFARMRENGRLDVLDNYLSGEGLSITQVPTLPKRK